MKSAGVTVREKAPHSAKSLVDGIARRLVLGTLRKIRFGHLVVDENRDLEGQFDKIVSIEMIEAVGYQSYARNFSRCSALLKPSGTMLLQSITIADQRYDRGKDNMDFIQQYIFPGGCLSSLAVIADHVRRDTDMQIVGLEDPTGHYVRTLADWRKRFFLRIDEVRGQGFDDVFIRMWDFHLSHCEGGFRERVIGTVQILLAKPGCRDLPAVGIEAVDKGGLPHL